jgi:hypothetical protein
MAVGYPVKADYATGDVLTAAQMNDLAGTLNTVPSTVGGQVNPVINGGLDIWQRGTSAFTAANVFTADRWQKDGVTTSTVSREATSDTTNLPNIQYCVRTARTNGDSNTNARGVYQALETSTSFPYIGKTITVSYYARKGSSFTGTLNLRFMTGTGTDQSCSFATNMTGQVNTDTAITSSVTTTWQRFAATFTVPTTATQIALGFRHAPVGTTSNTNDYFELTGVQIDVGTYTASTAPAFRRSGGTIQQELAACQRYYIRIGGDTNTTPIALGIGESTTSGLFIYSNPVTMRAAPTSIDFSTLAITDYVAFTNNITGLTLGSANRNSTRLSATGSSGITIKSVVALVGNGSGNFFGLSAEL